MNKPNKLQSFPQGVKKKKKGEKLALNQTLPMIIPGHADECLSLWGCVLAVHYRGHAGTQRHTSQSSSMSVASWFPWLWPCSKEIEFSDKHTPALTRAHTHSHTHPTSGDLRVFISEVGLWCVSVCVCVCVSLSLYSQGWHCPGYSQNTLTPAGCRLAPPPLTSPPLPSCRWILIIQGDLNLSRPSNCRHHYPWRSWNCFCMKRPPTGVQSQ